MLTQAAAVIRILAMALWVGGGVALDFIEAPLRFASGVIDRNQAVALGQMVITRWTRAEWMLGVIVLVASAFAAGPAWSVWLVVGMLAVVAVQAAYVGPAITRLASGLDFIHRTPGDPRYAAMRHLHTVYSVLEVALLLAGVVALIAFARAARR